MTKLKSLLLSCLVFPCLVLVFNIGAVQAQESIMSDFSYLYMEKLIAVAKEKNPHISIQDNRINIAKNNVDIAKISWLDPFSFSYTNRTNVSGIAGLNNDMLSGFFLSIGVAPISTLVKTPLNVKNAKLERDITKSEKDEYELQLEAEVKRRYIAYVQSLNILKLTNKRLVDAESTFSSMKARYERSEISFKDFNDASTFLTSVQEAKVSAEANLFTTKFALEELLTVKLEEIK